MSIDTSLRPDLAKQCLELASVPGVPFRQLERHIASLHEIQRLRARVDALIAERNRLRTLLGDKE